MGTAEGSDGPGTRLTRVRGGVLLLAGLCAVGLLLAAALSRSSPRAAASSDVVVQTEVTTLPAGSRACQPHELIAAGTRAVMVHGRLDGPSARVSVDLAGVHGEAVELQAGAPLVLPFPGLPGGDRLGQACIENAGPAPLVLAGAGTGPADQLVVERPGAAPELGGGRVRLDQRTSMGDATLWSLLDDLPERIAAGTGVRGAAWLVAGGVAIALAAAVALLWRRGRSGTRGDLAWVVLATLAIGTAWAALSPALHPTDELAHVAYVQAVAELGHPPRQLQDSGEVSGELACWSTHLGLMRVRWAPAERPPWSDRQRHGAARDCARHSRRSDAAQYHGFQPPAYYLLAAAAYGAGEGSSLPTRLLLARLVSVMLTAVAVACAYLLVRELITGSRWPARAGALALAFQPVFLFNQAAVNPDALVVAVAAAIALVLARAWRRGLTVGRALALGALTGIGVVTKANFLLLLPAIAFAAGALWWGVVRTGPAGTGRRAALWLTSAATLALACVGAYALVNDRVWERGLTFRQAAFSAGGGDLGRLLSHAWQIFLPPLPSMQFRITDGMPVAWTTLVEGATVRFGWWNDFGLARGWELLGLLVIAVVALGAARWLLPRARRRPRPALVAAGCVVLFLSALVAADYRYALGTGASSLEGRYVFPLIPLWALTVGASVASAPPRWRPAATAALTTVFVGYTVVAIFAMVARYYL